MIIGISFDNYCKVFLITGILEEAEFYNIANLVHLVKQKIDDRDMTKNQVCACDVNQIMALYVSC